ncbi:hypothetical protein [Streptomyces sp. 135]|uniref:hypothetical protein n=1 Tax=Streptomyces sp. 135 TaxID=2838850 RepID=UPI001CC06938|nr:hypothetical protein [Streptomyces sp. 135]
MRIADHATWDRGFPVKFLLVQEDEDGVGQLWGRCAGVEGFFVDPVPPPREVLTLRGCRPDGLLSEVLAEPDVSLRGLGDVCVEVWDDEEPVQWWTLVDAVVLAHQPHSADPERYDIVLGAGVRNEERFFELPATPRFELFAGTTAAAASAGRCSGVDGLFKARVDPAPAPMELIGCEPAEPLLAALRRPRRSERDWAYLLVLDRHAAVMASRSVGLAITGARPSVLGGALVDITPHRWWCRSAIAGSPPDLGGVVSGPAHRTQPVGAVRLAGQGRVVGPHHSCLEGARAPAGSVRR